MTALQTLSLDQKACDKFTRLNISLSAPATMGGKGFIGKYASLLRGGGLINADMGSYSYSSSILYNCAIGNYCSLAGKINCTLRQHPLNRISSSMFSAAHDNGASRFFKRFKNRVDYDQSETRAQIGHDVWIGEGVTVFGGIKIGTGAVIGTASMLIEDVPDYAVVVGNPGRIVKMRFSDNIIEQLLQLQWWLYDWSNQDVRWDNVADSINMMLDIINSSHPPKLLNKGYVYTTEGGKINLNEASY